MENWMKLVKNNETWNMKPQSHLFIPSSFNIFYQQNNNPITKFPVLSIFSVNKSTRKIQAFYII